MVHSLVTRSIVTPLIQGMYCNKESYEKIGTTFGHAHILMHFPQGDSNISLLLFAKVYTNMVLLGEVKPKGETRTLLVNPHNLPNFTLGDTKLYMSFLYSYIPIWRLWLK